MIKKLYHSFVKPENNKKIGLFRILTAIFGGLLTAYLGMTSLALVLPFAVQDTSVVALFFNTLAWAIMIIWISVSQTKIIALLRFMIPTSIFSIIIYFLY